MTPSTQSAPLTKTLSRPRLGSASPLSTFFGEVLGHLEVKDLEQFSRVAKTCNNIVLRFLATPHQFMTPYNASILRIVCRIHPLPNGPALHQSYQISSNAAQWLASNNDESPSICPLFLGISQNKTIVLAAVKQVGKTLKHAHDSLKADKEVVLAAITNDEFSLEHADVSLRANKEVVLAAVTRHGATLRFAANFLKADREVVLAAVTNYYAARQYADDSLKNDPEIVHVAQTLGSAEFL